MNQRRVAVVTGIPAPYREPVFERLAKQPGVDLKVYYCAHGHQNVAWSADSTSASRDYPCEFLGNLTPPRWQRLPMVGYANVDVTARLRAFRPDFVVVYGYNQLTHWLTFRYCRVYGVPFALRSDSNHRIDCSTSVQSKLRRRLLRRLVRDSFAVLPVGTANREYWQSYGATDAQIYMAPFAIDNQRVAELAGVRTPNQGACRFLYAGRLVPRKGVDLLLHAFNSLCEKYDVSLSVVGDGHSRDELMSLQSPAARERTTWHGRLPNGDVFRKFSEADVFVLPSRYEPWGLVVNEAMAAGLPVVADQRCGAAIDLVHDGETGRLLQTLSSQTLEAAMERFAQCPAEAKEMGDRARARIANWTYDHCVAGFMSAIQAAPKVRRRRRLRSIEPQQALTGSAP